MSELLKFALATGAVLSGTSTYSEAQIVLFDLSQPVTGNYIEFSFTGKPYVLSNTGYFKGSQFKLGQTTSYTGHVYHLVDVWPGGGVVSTPIAGFYYATKLTLGMSIGASSSFINADENYVSSYINGVDAVTFPEDGSKGYIGLREDGKYGWAEISLNSDGTMTLYGGAFEATPGEAIKAGDTGTAVPEPSTTALILFTGAAVALAARRRRREAAGFPA